MISRIRMRIFVPVLILIVLFPVLAGFIFSTTSGWYMNRLSRQSLSVMMGSIRTMADRLYSGEEDMTRDEEKELSRELMSEVRAFIRKDRPQSQFLAMNSRMKLTYPRTEDYQADTQVMYEVCRELAAGGEMTGDGNEVKEISVGDTRYLVSLYEARGEANIRGKYMFGYVAVPDTKALLSYTGLLLCLIAGALLILALAAAWWMAGSISKPLQALCRHTKSIGKGEFAPMEETCSIREIEELRCGFNRMAEELERMNRQQNAFFQNASHELRTPLMSICGYAQGIQCGVFPDHGEAAGIILEETMRMKELVDGILTVSKMDGGRLELNLVHMDLRRFVREELAALGGMEITAHVRLEADCGDGPVTAFVDAGLLTQALRNVISNCVRYASERVDVSVRRDGKWAVIVVKDDGPGFSGQDMPHVFERFYKGKGGNFGIGLSIVRSAMEYLGGRAEAQNRRPPEHGAVFSLYLPAEE